MRGERAASGRRPAASGGRRGGARWRRAAALLVATAAVVCVPDPAGSAGATAARRLDAGRGPLAARVSIARLQYDGGGDWYANPSSIPHLLNALATRTTLDVDRTEGRVRLLDERLWDYPFLHATGHGNMRLTDAEVERLREYLQRGGFLHVSDNYGLDESFRREIARVFPDRPLVDVPLSHPVYHLVYDFPRGLPKIHEHDAKPARGLGIFLGDRLAVYYDYQSDLGNGWEDPATYNDPPELHEAALRMGVNLVMYAVTSRTTP